MTVEIFAKNYRGFRELHFPLDGTSFLVGDNSSGKSSLLNLANYVVSTELQTTRVMKDSESFSRYDFFSPYFSFADVTIGFTSSGKKRKISKLITMKRRVDLLQPAVPRFTVVNDGVRFTFRQTERGYWYKTSVLPEDYTWLDLCDLHEESSGFKRLPADAFDEEPPINSTGFAFEIVSKRLIDNRLCEDLIPSLAPAIPFDSAHIGPLRQSPVPFYNHERKYNIRGSHFASMWHDMMKSKQAAYLDDVRQFGAESQLFDDLSVEKLSKKVTASPLIVTVKKHGKDFTLAQVGVGISQVVPVLVEAIFRKWTGDSIVMLLQQPELHLHPVAQAALGEFIFNMANESMWFFIETHSDYLIDRFRVNIKEKATAKPARVIFCENNQEGNHCTVIPIGDDGEILDPPENYRDFQLNELMRTMF